MNTKHVREPGLVIESLANRFITAISSAIVYPMRIVWAFLILSNVAVLSSAALAATKENLGTLTVSDVLLRPNFTTGSSDIEDRGFNIGESSLAVQWALNDQFSGHMRVGPRSLIAPPVHYKKTVASDVVLVEA